MVHIMVIRDNIDTDFGYDISSEDSSHGRSDYYAELNNKQRHLLKQMFLYTDDDPTWGTWSRD